MDAGLWGALERTQERLDVVSAYVAHVQTLILTEDADLRVEQRVQFAFLAADGASDCYGTADAILWTRTKLIVVDLKTGSGVNVEAEDNEQLSIYALAALDSHPTLAQWVTEVECHIVQPRTSKDAKVWAVPRVELEARRNAIKRAIVVGRSVLALKEARPEHFAPGDHCKFCGAAATCAARQSFALVAAQGMFDALDAPPPSLPTPVNMTPEQLQLVLDREGVLVDWLKLVREEAGNRLARGLPVPGYKLVQRLGNRKWSDEAAAARTLETMGVDPMERSMKSPAAIERELGKSGGAGVVASLTERPVLSPVLARADDKRAAAQPLTFPRETGGQG